MPESVTYVLGIICNPQARKGTVYQPVIEGPPTRGSSKPGVCGSFAGLCAAHFVRGLNQVRQFGLRVVRGDPPAPMTKQVLAIFKAHVGRAQSPTKRVLHVMGPNLSEARRRWYLVSLHALIRRPFPWRFPRGVIHLAHRP